MKVIRKFEKCTRYDYIRYKKNNKGKYLLKYAVCSQAVRWRRLRTCICVSSRVISARNSAYSGYNVLSSWLIRTAIHRHVQIFFADHAEIKSYYNIISCPQKTYLLLMYIRVCSKYLPKHFVLYFSNSKSRKWTSGFSGSDK